MDYQWVTCMIHPQKWIPNIPFSGDQNCYELNDDVFEMYKAHVALFARQTQLWPLIKLAMVSGNKWTMITDLWVIAKEVGGYVPATVLFTEDQEIPSSMVLKQSNSECGDHIILPNSNPHHWTWKYKQGITSKDMFRMVQEHIPSLTEMGEWRVFIVSSKIITVMHSRKETSKGDWRGDQTNTFLTLDEIRYINVLTALRWDDNKVIL